MKTRFDYNYTFMKSLFAPKKKYALQLPTYCCKSIAYVRLYDARVHK